MPAATLAFLLLAQEMPEDLRRVGERIAPAVVRIQHGEGFGTGFLIDPRGYVLTNAHVCSSPLPSVVQVSHPVDGRWTTLTYRRVLLAGFHPTLDLALLRIDPAEHGRPLPSLRLADRPPARGARVYTMGFPADVAGGKKKILSHGRLIALDRMVWRQKYLETDAVVFGGNSGGPLCTESGEVVGVITLKRSPDNTGLAIPVWALRPGGFVPLHQRPRDAAAALELLHRAEKSFDLARRGVPGARELGLSLYHEAAIVDVGNPEIYRKLGLAMADLGFPRDSAAYLTRALQITPWPRTGPSTHLALARVLGTLGRAEDAFAVLQEALWKHPDDGDRILGPLSMAALSAARPADAGFYAHLGGHVDLQRAVRRLLGPDDLAALDRREVRGEIWLEQRRREAAVARQEGRACLTPEFAAFMKGFDGVQREGAPAALTRFDVDAVKAQADGMSAEDVSTRFIRARLDVALGHLAKGRRDLAEPILRDLIRERPDDEAVREAARLLD